LGFDKVGFTRKESFYIGANAVVLPTKGFKTPADKNKID
jgi:hypothetical protein